MSEALDRVRGVRELPLFPLPIILFPGVPLPLHIFEPRYQDLLRDARAGNNFIGISYFDAGEADTSEPLVGHVGCLAEIVDAEPQPDGRFNIITVGVIRYHIDDYVERGDAYLVGRPAFFEDDAEDVRELKDRASEVSSLFMRIARAMRTINDERASLPDLPEADPERLSFLVAAALELDAEVKLELLETRSTVNRLTRIRDLLHQAAGNYEERARVHGVAKTNGHSGKKFPHG